MSESRKQLLQIIMLVHHISHTPEQPRLWYLSSQLPAHLLQHPPKLLRLL